MDLYSNFPINEKVDIYALGVVLFILCFQKPPFESKLASITNQYFLPESHIFSENIIRLIEHLFISDPRKRMNS